MLDYRNRIFIEEHIFAEAPKSHGIINLNSILRQI